MVHGEGLGETAVGAGGLLAMFKGDPLRTSLFFIKRLYLHRFAIDANPPQSQRVQSYGRTRFDSLL